jgi:hypothetical protein
MARQRETLQDRLQRFAESLATADEAAVGEALRAGLRDRHYLLVARAAEVCAERLLYDLEAELKTAWERLLPDAAKHDRQCTAKSAIARALVTLDSQDAGFFLAGLRYRRFEPVYGGSVDTAGDLRSSCALGLVGTAYPRAVVALAELLADPEPGARIGALRAIACTPPLPAEALLRFKALNGDPLSEVSGECLRALLQVAAEEAVDLVAGVLGPGDPEVQTLAALALGESRLPEAVDALRDAFDGVLVSAGLQQILIRSAVIHRSDAAFDWLLAVAETGSPMKAGLVIEELAVYRSRDGLRQRLERVLEGRGDARLLSLFGDCWQRE